MSWKPEEWARLLGGGEPTGPAYTHTFIPRATGSITVGPRQAWRIVWYLLGMLLRHPRSAVTVEFGDDGPPPEQPRGAAGRWVTWTTLSDDEHHVDTRP